MSNKKQKSTKSGYSIPTTATPVAESTAIIEVPTNPANRKAVQIKYNTTKTTEKGGGAARMPFAQPQEAKIREFLTSHHWPTGLQEALIKSCKKIPIRYIITDDSGSMMTNDGHRLIGSGTNIKMIQCTRWSELTSSLLFHAELAHKGKALTQFRLLNKCEPILVGELSDVNGEGLEAIAEMFEESPGGQTPLCAHVAEVIECIRARESELRAAGQRACVVIATDGESSDGDMAEALKPLQDLPVWVVVRLCTDEDTLVDYWNNIDTQLELEMDVLDDFVGEAKEVRDANPWLAYGDPLQKFREFGAIVKEMDLLDESCLSSEQMRVVASLLVADGKVRSLPHPDEDWGQFLGALKPLNAAERKVWDPVLNKQMEWINVKKLTDIYGAGSGGSSTCIIQ